MVTNFNHLWSNISYSLNSTLETTCRNSQIKQKCMRSNFPSPWLLSLWLWVQAYGSPLLFCSLEQSMVRMKLEECPSKISCQRLLASTKLPLAIHFITIHNLLLDSGLFENIWINSGEFLKKSNQMTDNPYCRFSSNRGIKLC